MMHRQSWKINKRNKVPAVLPNRHASFNEKNHSALHQSPIQHLALRQWPCQIKLAPVQAPYYQGAKLLIAADCSAYAYAQMHDTFMKGKITLIGCPKLDQVDYSEKLTAIIQTNAIQSVTIVRMEVPCCGGLEMAVKKALQASGKLFHGR